MGTRLQLVESYLMSASGDPGGGGDATVHAADHAAVIDGVTSKTRLTFDGLKGDQFAARTVSQAVRELPAGVSAVEAVALVNAALSAAVADLGFDADMVHLPSARAAIVSHSRQELWQVGDVAALLDGELLPGEAPPSDAVLSGARAFFLSAALKGGVPRDSLLEQDPSVALLLPLREVQQQFANDASSPWGYASLDGGVTPDRFIQVTDISGVHEVVLASNGFAAVRPTLAETLAEHARLVEADPLCVFENPQLRKRSTVGWDDMAYLRLRRS